MSDYDTWEEEAPAKEVTKEAPIAPPKRNQGSVDLGPLPSNLMSTLKPGVLNVPEPVSTTELAKDVKNAQETVGAPQAANPLDQLNLKKHMHDFVESDAFLPSVIAAGLGATALIGKHLSNKPKSTAERDIRRIEPEMDVNKQAPNGRVEPTFDWKTVPTNPQLDTLNQTLGGELQSRQDATTIAKSENNKAMKSGQPLPFPEVQNPQEVAKEVAPESPITASTSPEESATIANLTKASKTPSEAVAEPSKAVAEPSKEVVGAVKPVRPAINELHKLPGVSPQLAKHLEKTGSELAGNEAFTKAYAKAKIPEGQVFLPGLGAMDNTMFNTLGPEGRRQAMEMLNNDLPFGTVGAEHNTKAKELIGDYGKKLSELTGQDLTTREQRIAQGLEHTKNYGTLGKAAKIGGVGGLFLAFDQLANAKSPAERREILRNTGESFLPVGATPTTAGAPTLPPSVIEAQRQATLLGSPYHKFK